MVGEEANEAQRWASEKLEVMEQDSTEHQELVKRLMGQMMKSLKKGDWVPKMGSQRK